MPKILILRFSSIGDIVLTTPVIRAVKQQVPGAEVHYCTKPNFRSVMEANPYIDKIHYLPEKLNHLIAELKTENFDFVIDLHHNLRTRAIKTRLGVKSKSFDKLNFEKWLLVNFKVNRMPAVHIVDRYVATAAPLGIKNDGLGLDYFIPEKDEVAVSSLPETHQKGYAGFAIGAQHFTKRLPLEKLIEACTNLARPIILLGGKEDFEIGEQIRLHFENTPETLLPKPAIYNACGQYNLNQSASLVRQADLIISHDTGLMHIAAAFKKKIISIWGNTVPEFGMYPYKTDFEVLEVKGLSCRPCSKIGYNKCPQGHFKCMKEQDLSVLGRV